MNIPNILTFLRLLLVPVLLGLWEWNWKWSPITAAIVFITAALTDWLDGYLARKVNEKQCWFHFRGSDMQPMQLPHGLVSSPLCPSPHKSQCPPIHSIQLKVATVFGAFLDPVADKIM